MNLEVNPVIILELAAQIVEKGWTKGWFASKFEQDKTVKKEKIIEIFVPSKSEEATHFCMLGSILRALYDTHGSATQEETEKCLSPLRKLCAEKFRSFPGGVNDRLNSAEEAAALLREAKNYVL